MSETTDWPGVNVVVVAFGPEPWLESCVDAILASRGVQVRLILVDNGGTEGRVDRLSQRPDVHVVRPGRNAGFATGCNLGVAAGTAPMVVLVNPDARVHPDAIAALVRVAARPEVGLATGSIRLADDPDRLNSAGNALHFLGLSWAGAFGEPAADHADEVDVTCASGAAMACRREVWEALGGLDDRFFAYGEDADLSLRAWQRGLAVRYVPDAVVVHRYEFSRNAFKYRLLERNRLVIVLTDLGAGHLLRALPALLVVEALLLVYATLGGWLGAKLDGYRWLVGHRGWLRRRRRLVQSARTVPDRDLAGRFATRLRPNNLALPRALLPVDLLLAAWWALVRRTL